MVREGYLLPIGNTTGNDGRKTRKEKGKAKAKLRLLARNSYSPVTHFTELKMCSFGLYFLFFYFFAYSYRISMLWHIEHAVWYSTDQPKQQRPRTSGNPEKYHKRKEEGMEKK